MKLPQDIEMVLKKATCLYTKDEVERALDKIAQNMERELADKNPVFLCLVVGGIIPLGNLLIRLNFPLEVDYLHVTRYRGKLIGGELTWKAKPTISLKDRTVVLVDDILDSGLTMQSVSDYCIQHEARKVYTAVLVDKKDARVPGGTSKADFVGLEVENRYVFGYGLDYKEYLRNAPGIYAVAPEHQ